MNLSVGDIAEDFTLNNQHGDPVSLSSFRGQPVLLYFYPKDETPGCTIQAQHIRDAWAEYEELGVAVIGISPDDVASHSSFCDNHDLPQTLLADPSKDVLTTYGVYGEKVLYGKTVIGVTRATVLLDANGKAVKIWKRAQAKNHTERALKAIRELL